MQIYCTSFSGKVKPHPVFFRKKATAKAFGQRQVYYLRLVPENVMEHIGSQSLFTIGSPGMRPENAMKKRSSLQPSRSTTWSVLPKKHAAYDGAEVAETAFKKSRFGSAWIRILPVSGIPERFELEMINTTCFLPLFPYEILFAHVYYAK